MGYAFVCVFSVSLWVVVQCITEARRCCRRRDKLIGGNWKLDYLEVSCRSLLDYERWADLFQNLRGNFLSLVDAGSVPNEYKDFF